MSERTTWTGRLVALGIGLVLALAVAEGVLRVAMPHWQDFYSGRFMREIVVPEFGTVATGRPGFDGHFAQNNGDFRVRVAINAFGLRNPEPVDAADGRIWIVGDSMAFGWGVEQDEMYSSVIGKTVGVPAYNIASPGTNVCGYQALVARMPDGVEPAAMIVGLILENDIGVYDCRAAARKTAGKEEAESIGSGTLKGLLTRHSALYNFLAVVLKRVEPVRDALTALGVIRESHGYVRKLDEGAVTAAVARTADEIAALRDMLPRGTSFAVLQAPARFEIASDDAFFRKLRLSMAAALADRGIAVIDPYEAFRRAGFGATHFAHDGHWSPKGHAVAAAAAAGWLTEQGIGRP